ncbi:hypothetical protein B0H10DRAFT_2371168 [Mycena sp. CBHHK59/15]|nr:hypothetical protein B0H10DRAFT_2371168 [Mycena sp. CBHHK59/15]
MSVTGNKQIVTTGMGKGHEIERIQPRATALVYLHSEDGDLTAANVLIDDHEDAVLSDFGLATIIAEFIGTSYMTTSLARVARTKKARRRWRRARRAMSIRLRGFCPDASRSTGSTTCSSFRRERGRSGRPGRELRMSEWTSTMRAGGLCRHAGRRSGKGGLRQLECLRSSRVIESRWSEAGYWKNLIELDGWGLCVPGTGLEKINKCMGRLLEMAGGHRWTFHVHLQSNGDTMQRVTQCVQDGA